MARSFASSWIPIRIVNRDLYVRSQAYVEQWQPRLGAYVLTDAHATALALIKKSHFWTVPLRLAKRPSRRRLPFPTLLTGSKRSTSGSRTISLHSMRLANLRSSLPMMRLARSPSIPPAPALGLVIYRASFGNWIRFIS